MNSKSNTKTVSLLKQNRKDAFELLYRSYSEKLYVFAFRMTSDRSLSQNIIQDIFIALWEKKDSLAINNIESYLFQAVKYQVFKSYRDKKFNKEILESRFDDFIFNQADTTDQELANKLFSSLNNLPERRKEILVMSKLQELSIDQIANELQISKQTVKNQLSTAIKQLRLILKIF